VAGLTGRANYRVDAVVIGGGHNALMGAGLLAQAGRSVLVLERLDRVGGAAISETIFPGVDARLSRYSYLVSLFPQALLRQLGLEIGLRRRPSPSLGEEWTNLRVMLKGVGERVFPTLTQPLVSREKMRRLVADDEAWEALFERPLSEFLERTISDDAVRGIALTDATIGTFAPANDPGLGQNRCFLHHVIGNGHGRWDVPVGGMGSVTDALRKMAADAGASILTSSEVVSVATDGQRAEVTCVDGETYECRHVLAGIAPARLHALLGDHDPAPTPEGSQLKVNMLVERLPRLRDRAMSPEEAFAGTFHVAEGYEQLARAYEEAAAGHIPAVPPCELYCHSLSDPSILAPELTGTGVHTLTLFGLHMPARLFREDHARRKEEALAATLRSVNGVLAEPVEDCLMHDAAGKPCLEALTPLELEAELGMPGGHIFHRDLAWPFAESDDEVGRWGVETEHANVWLCGAGARRGGGVSGIPGHNAAQAVLEAARAAR
jgi:phytoene dehydrogenase-like protein